MKKLTDVLNDNLEPLTPHDISIISGNEREDEILYNVNQSINPKKPTHERVKLEWYFTEVRKKHFIKGLTTHTFLVNIVTKEFCHIAHVLHQTIFEEWLNDFSKEKMNDIIKKFDSRKL